ncbi:Sec-independent protein translocase subunit TatA [uncultured Demequina sp.]|uniref:Sec-independent protein translocase subunit TatA n=1 Tax=uncultured Demequina sp. TaxID=693499 RepID=UPI0025F32EAF|nr:Sec-independent protein translocase subunit TatA [uncultured Demequina sp.]
MGPREIIIIAIIVVLLFGAPKLPELARSIGKSMKILKDETKSLSDDDKDSGQDDSSATGTAPDSTVELPDDEGRAK